MNKLLRKLRERKQNSSNSAVHTNAKKINKAAIYVLAAIVISQYVFIFISIAGEMTTKALLSCTNDMRHSRELGDLYLNERLNVAAKEKLEDMKKYGYWAHENPNTGEKPWDFVDRSGYYYVTTGENLAFGFSDSDKVCEAWQDSQTHYENIINDTYQEIGFAIESVKLANGRGLLVVQMFGSRSDFKEPKTPLVANEETDSEIFGDELVHGVYQEKAKSLLDPNILKHVILFVILGSYLTLRSVLLYNKNRTLSIQSSMVLSAFMAIGAIVIVFLYFYL